MEEAANRIACDFAVGNQVACAAARMIYVMCGTDDEGWYEFVTVKPGPVPAPGGGMQAPHIDMSVFARGLLKRVVTRIYFPDEAEANAADPLLSSLPPERAATLVAAASGDGELRFDIRLQGEGETVFLQV